MYMNIAFVWLKLITMNFTYLLSFTHVTVYLKSAEKLLFSKDTEKVRYIRMRRADIRVATVLDYNALFS